MYDIVICVFIAKLERRAIMEKRSKRKRSRLRRLWLRKSVSITSLIAGALCIVMAFALPNLIYKTPLNLFVEGEYSIISRYYMDIILNRLKVILTMFGSLVVASALFCLFFRRYIHKHCTHRTSGVCLLLSMVMGLGLYCLLVFISYIANDEIALHPVSFISSIIFGIGSTVACLFLFRSYIRLRKKKSSLNGITIDFIFAIVYLVPFYTLYDALHGFLSKLV
jgi:hypothetical protein